MKKLSLFCVSILIISLCGCSVLSLDFDQGEVMDLYDLSFQYNEDSNNYSIFFALLTKSFRTVAADLHVDVRIVNDDGVTVYQKTHAVTKEDFAIHMSQFGRKEYGVELTMAASDLAAGTAAGGRVYLNAYQPDNQLIDEADFDVYRCLPLLDIQIVAEGLPIELNVKAYDGTVASKIRIEEVTMFHDKDFPSRLQINLRGTKTYSGTNPTYDMISYKIYDHGGFMIQSGEIFLDNLSAQDKFKDDSIVLYDAVPGETYTITFHGS